MDCSGVVRGAATGLKRGDAHPDGFGCSTDVKGTTEFFLVVVFLVCLARGPKDTIREPPPWS